MGVAVGLPRKPARASHRRSQAQIVSLEAREECIALGDSRGPNGCERQSRQSTAVVAAA